MARTRFCLGALFVLIGALGCSLVNDPSRHRGGDSGPSDSGPPTVRADAFCELYANAYCEAAGSCCSMPGYVRPTNCVALVSSECIEARDALMTDTRVRYDSVAAAVVLEEVREFFAMCATTQFLDWSRRRDGFFRVYSGTIEGGTSCELGYILTAQRDLLISVLGCSDIDQTCRPVSIGGERSCLERGDVGETCYNRLDCKDGMRCVKDPDGLFAVGVCQNMGEPDSSACFISDECQSLNCVGATAVVGSCQPSDAEAIYCLGADSP